jgi:energy-coupling factor transporter ATP-binding protein EcfA2
MPFAGIRRWTARKALLERGDEATIAALGLDDSDAVAAVHAHISHDNAVSNQQWLAAQARKVTVRRLGSLESIEIRNFRAITNVSLRFRELRPNVSEPWLLLLGENGVGKSSVLKAVALALMSSGARKRFVPNASDLVREGARRGEIRLGFSGGSEVRLSLRRGEAEFDGQAPSSPVLVGYGPTRLPPASSGTSRRQSSFDVDNLFDPWATLLDAESWLADNKRVPAGRFNLFATDLKTLLPMTEEDRLTRRTGRLYARSHGSTVPLAQLSDGYRSVIGLATDLMMRLSASVDSMRAAEGLLLLDEIEAHLHPQWRMTIVSLLREVFPNLRVIATTHDPLCLQQTEPGEVFVLRRIGGSHVEAVPRDVPKGLRADQLLTGDWFGLSNTTDPETAEMQAEYGRLLIAKQTPKVRQERNDLEASLRERSGHFAETSIERLALDVAAKIADEESADLGQAGPEERAQMAESVLDAVRRRREQQR